MSEKDSQHTYETKMSSQIKRRHLRIIAGYRATKANLTDQFIKFKKTFP